MFAARRALHAKSHRSCYTGFYIAAVLFLLLQDFLLRPVLNFSPRGTRAFTVFSLFCNEKIAAPRRTRVTNSTKICRNSLVARYAAPPCVTRYAATYIASTVNKSDTVPVMQQLTVTSNTRAAGWGVTYRRDDTVCVEAWARSAVGPAIAGICWKAGGGRAKTVATHCTWHPQGGRLCR